MPDKNASKRALWFVLLTK